MIGIKSIEIMVWGFFLVSYVRCLINNSIKNILIFRNFEDGQILERSSSIIAKKFKQFHTNTKSNGSSFFFTNTCQRVDPISMVLHIALSTLSLFFFHSLVFSLLRSFTFSFFRFLASQQKQTWKIKKKSSYNVDPFISLCCTVHILKMASNNSTVDRVVKWRQFKITRRDIALFHDNYHNYYRQSIFSS